MGGGKCCCWVWGPDPSSTFLRLSCLLSQDNFILKPGLRDRAGVCPQSQGSCTALSPGLETAGSERGFSHHCNNSSYRCQNSATQFARGGNIVVPWLLRGDALCPACPQAGRVAILSLHLNHCPLHQLSASPLLPSPLQSPNLRPTPPHSPPPPFKGTVLFLSIPVSCLAP